MEIDIGHIVLLSVAGTVVWRWLRTRHLLYRITEKTEVFFNLFEPSFETQLI